jgi:DNA-binding response OmpR family regulator
MSGKRILVAEDDANIRDGLVDTLGSEGYVADAARDGEEALALFLKRSYDLVILDIMMPGRSGYDVCRAIRARDADVPVLMLTARSAEIDKVVGLELGADDYVTKPFGVRELLARLAALLRRSRRTAGGAAGRRAANADDPDAFAFGEAAIDARQFKARLGRATHDLSARELKLLRIFRAHPGDVLSRDRLLNEAWGMDYFGTTRTLDQHIAKLRKKVERDPAAPRCIETIHGVGYRYVPADRKGG